MKMGTMMVVMMKVRMKLAALMGGYKVKMYQRRRKRLRSVLAGRC